MPHYTDQLAEAVSAKSSPLVVGIDPRWEQLPDALRGDDSLAGKADAYRRFAVGVIEAVADIVPAVKPQMAFFEELGAPGMAALSESIERA
ncbi:MAG: orotidine 5'-phosphate decarboxylase, partial [Planctomycetota bacterium]